MTSFGYGRISRSAPTMGAAPTIAFPGDSIIAASISQDTGTLVANYNQGPGFWVPALTRQRVRTRKDLNFGINGETSTGLLARIDAICACDADIVALMIGTNDVNTANASTLATYKSNMTQILRRLLAAGKLVIAVCPLNRNLVSATARPLLQQMIRWVRELQWRGWRNLYVVDPNVYWTDPLSATSAPKSYYDVDGLHPRGLGSYFVWKPVAELIATLYPTVAVHPTVSAADVYEPDWNPSGNLLPNGIMDGSSAVSGSGGPNFTGTQATNTTILGVAGTGGVITGLNVACSKVPLANGLPGQQIAISGTGTGSSASPGSGVIVRQSVASPGSKLAAGDTIEALATIEWDGVGSQNIAGIRARLRTIEGGTTYDVVDAWDSIADLLPPVNDSWTLRTPPRLLTAAPSSVELSIWCTLRNQSSASFAGTFRVGALHVGKVIA
jgi:lysophospholipase L1-like esterase